MMAFLGEITFSLVFTKEFHIRILSEHVPDCQDLQVPAAIPAPDLGVQLDEDKEIGESLTACRYMCTVYCVCVLDCQDVRLLVCPICFFSRF